VEFRFVLHPRQEFAGLQRRDLLRRDVQFHGLLTEVGVFLDRADQLELPLGRAERVDRMIRVLLEEDFADHPGDLERELLVRRQGVRADETDDFLELRLFLQRPLRPRSQLRPVLVHVLPEPVLQDLRVQAVRLKPVDRREMPPSPQGGVQCSEHLHDAEGALGDGLREVPAARGHRTDDADGPFQASQGLRPTRTLVELAEPRRQVRWEAFLARHLVPPLPAADVHEDLRVAPRRELLLCHRVVEETRHVAAAEVMRLRYREIEHPRSAWNRFRLDDYIPSDGTVLERHRKTVSAFESRGLDFHNARAPCEQPVDGGNPKRSSAVRSDPDETIRKATVENRREGFFDLVSVKSQDRDRIVEANPGFPLTAHTLTPRAVVQLVDADGVAAWVHHQSVGCDTLPRPEAARDGGGPALCDREQEVEDPLARDERDRRHEPIPHRPGPANGPGLVHLHLFAVVELRDDLVDFERALANLCDLPTPEVRGDHDPMLDIFRLLDRAHDLARAHGLARLHLRGEGPRLLSGETRGLHPAEDEISHHLLEDRERPLDAVVDAPEEAGPQFDDEGSPRVEDGFPRPDAARVLVDLD